MVCGDFTSGTRTLLHGMFGPVWTYWVVEPTCNATWNDTGSRNEKALRWRVVVLVNDGPAIECAMLTLIPWPAPMIRRSRNRRPSFDRPARIVRMRYVGRTGNFA